MAEELRYLRSTTLSDSRFVNVALFLPFSEPRHTDEQRFGYGPFVSRLSGPGSCSGGSFTLLVLFLFLFSILAYLGR